MRTLRTAALALSAALLTAACSSGGTEADPGGGDTGGGPAPAPGPAPSPNPPPSPPPAPPPNPGNGDPVANAGADQNTVERQGVTIDGSKTRDPENDPITYQWQLVSAPTGSAAAVGATTPTFQFMPDLPGTYEIRLTASDAGGSSTDTVRVNADLLMSFTGSASFEIDLGSRPGDDRKELTLRTSPHYRGPPVAFTVASDAPWLATTSNASKVQLQLSHAALGTGPNGEQKAKVTATPAGGYTPAVAEVTLNMALPLVRTVMPYVAYVGRAQPVTLYGDALAQTEGRTFAIAGQPMRVDSATGTRATAELPALTPGIYTLTIDNGLGIQRPMGHVVVRHAPTYQDAEVQLPGPVRSVEYDAERDVFYVVVAEGGGLGAKRIGRATGAWQVEPINVAAPRALALTADGSQLLVTADGCAVHHLEPITLTPLQSSTKPSCGGDERLGAIAVLGDGRVLIADDLATSAVWDYPAFTPSQVLPSAMHPLAIVNYTRNRLLWAEQPEVAGSWKLHRYSIGMESAREVSPHGAPGYLRSNLAVSGTGTRALHRADLYDGQMNFLGTLEGIANPQEMVPGLDSRGTRGVVLDTTQDAFVLYDLTRGGPTYPRVGNPIPLAGDLWPNDGVVIVAPTDLAAFAFTTTAIDPAANVYAHRLYVRTLPVPICFPFIGCVQ
jgi:hypothetical protein